jgi:hypothetical protein
MRLTYINHYRHCAESWQNEGDSMHSDECPACKKEIEPLKSDIVTEKE